ncbi:lactosylceramide alpha-2,3-sialyltransferase [Lethenteron reissneri]|uniref:lactosylceramide alpha-2,3-sialyltransferase n=1 Tax=Lethenteron reissneri TaxID=7753 RepID=UPI002AB6C84A|nr:lactosylceramide alpha-2,3-sialyltransferase [Lethenteron reissneri]XP_061408893.1 lactosylceramide alpha-2,3-sialyltransferase [Lethenteron reissneri]XP_061408894.1 lactosylceramide alpha-2,3-sialyltransferase [Lethenteron reissneri]XP_061408895.1 lactosylceramide alpha-2,3-sialyltransferase [Lethenteron reissneri]XP_061408896.1 lactosylceramide alpha-2,3-sialyltransferase [Lethenteron reissneri]XP_061408897.1 lactosylceramide alpha-2,3-sialyltransferase [Lethenteron reissneri]
MLSRPILCRRFPGLVTAGCLVCFFYVTLIQQSKYIQTDIWDNYKIDTRQLEVLHSFTKRVLDEPCRPGFARGLMTQLFPGRYHPELLPFISKNLSEMQSEEATGLRYDPPFGFRGQRDSLEAILGLMPETGLPVVGAEKGDVPPKVCRRCVVVGSGGNLRGTGLGPLLDNFDVVIRLNNAPIIKFENDVGSKTTVRITYPEGAPKSMEEYKPDSIFAAVMYKGVDFKWLESIIKKEHVSLWTKLWFWQSVADRVPLGPSQFRILNLEIIGETSMDLLGYPKPRKRIWGWDKNIPTLGVSAVVFATHLCDEVSLAGFGYDLSRPDAPLHYYENVRMDAMKAQPMHNVDGEKLFLAGLINAGVISDLTGGVQCTFCQKRDSGGGSNRT